MIRYHALECRGMLSVYTIPNANLENDKKEDTHK